MHERVESLHDARVYVVPVQWTGNIAANEFICLRAVRDAGDQGIGQGAEAFLSAEWRSGFGKCWSLKNLHGDVNLVIGKMSYELPGSTYNADIIASCQSSQC